MSLGRKDVKFSTDEIVDLVVDSGAIGNSIRQKKLLAYLLDHSFRKESHKISSYLIAVDVFGRPKDFDDSTDSIVRTEMYRLRKNLDSFNAKNSLQLSIPNRSYEIQLVKTQRYGNQLKELTYIGFVLLAGGILIAASYFGWKRYSNQQYLSAVCSDSVPNIHYDPPSTTNEFEILVHETVGAVVNQYSLVNLVSKRGSCDSDAPDYELYTASSIVNGTTHVSVTVHYSKTKEEISKHVVSVDIENDEKPYELIRYIGDLINPYGVIPRHSITVDWKDNESRQNIVCLAMMYDSYNSDAVLDYNAAATCLENVFYSGKASIDTIALLTESKLGEKAKNEATEKYGSYHELRGILEQASHSNSHTAISLDSICFLETRNPDYNAQVLQGYMYEIEKNFPLNSMVMMNVTNYYGIYLGHWEEALEKYEFYRKIHSKNDDSSFYLTRGYHLVHSTPEEALSWCIKAYSKDALVDVVVTNACARRANNKHWVEKTEEDLLGTVFETKERRISRIEEYNWHYSLKNVILDGLRTQI